MQAVTGEFIGRNIGANRPDLRGVGQQVSNDGPKVLLGPDDVLVSMEQRRQLRLVAPVGLVGDVAIGNQDRFQPTSRIGRPVPRFGELSEVPMNMPPRLRKGMLAAHLTCSVGWLGAVVAYLVLDLTVATSRDAQAVRAAWIAMGQVSSSVLVPVAVASLITGIVMSLGTKWGMFRHWWVLISILLTVFAVLVLLFESEAIRSVAAIAAEPTTSDGTLLALPSTLPHSVGGLVVLLVIQVLNVYKPQGLTPYGWRKLQEERKRHLSLKAGAQ